jgi:hypothetical protein
MKIIKASDNHYFIRHWFVWSEYYHPNLILQKTEFKYDRQTNPFIRTNLGPSSKFLTFKEYRFMAEFNNMPYTRLNKLGRVLMFLLSPLIKVQNWRMMHGNKRHTSKH